MPKKDLATLYNLLCKYYEETENEKALDLAKEVDFTLSLQN